MIDLNNLVSETSLTLVDSGKINDQGQIVGLALTSDGALHAFLATPDNDASGEMGSTAMIPNPQHRHVVALPAVAQKTLDRRMHPKFRHSGRVGPLDNSR